LVDGPGPGLEGGVDGGEDGGGGVVVRHGPSVSPRVQSSQAPGGGLLRGTRKRPRRGGGGARGWRAVGRGRSAVQRDAEDVGVREVVVHVRNDVGGAVSVLRELNDDGPNGRPGEDMGDGGGDSADGGVVAVGDAQAVAGAGGVVGVVDQRLAGAVEGGGGGGDDGHFCFLP